MKKDVIRENQANEAAREHEAKGGGRSGFSFGCGTRSSTTKDTCAIVRNALQSSEIITPSIVKRFCIRRESV